MKLKFYKVSKNLYIIYKFKCLEKGDILQKIGQGAEAEIFINENNNVLKQRIKKNYRIEEIDQELRKKRTSREYNILKKLEDIAPKPIKKTEYDIEMQYIKGDKIKNIINKENAKELLKDISEIVAKIHNKDIIHGDLTTSNMIKEDAKIYFIDFGLSFTSKKIEDKAVDIHLFRQNFESSHNEIYKKEFNFFFKNYYNNVNNSKEIKQRFDDVEKRGRNKH